MSDDGLVTMASNHPVKETIDGLEAAVKAAGLTVFARIDHAAGATAANLPLRPTELLIFGNAKGGTPLMQSRQTIGLDLPLKMLAWEDGSGKVWLTYSDIGWLAHRYGLGAEAEPAVAALGRALANLAARAVA